MSADAEAARLRDATERRAHWKRWGPYLSERAWGTVREDYSADGDAWDYFPHDHARSRAYRWNEDGLAGICDRHQLICFALALWNGRDPILKERLFGLTGPQGNHGEDVKEYYFYLDSTPTHSYMKWLYKYPAGRVSRTRSSWTRTRAAAATEPEFELLDTGVFDDDRYFDVFVEYAKASAEDIAHPDHGREPRSRGRRARPAADASGSATRWSWGPACKQPSLSRSDAHDGVQTVVVDEDEFGRRYLYCDGCAGAAVHRERDQRGAAVRAPRTPTPYVKDGIHDYVVHGDAAAVNPAAHRHQGRGALPRDDPGRRTAGRSSLRLHRRADRGAVRPALRGGLRRAHRRGRRVLRRASSPQTLTDDGAERDAAGVRRPAVEQAVLPLRRARLAGRRSRPARAAGRARARAATTTGRTSTTPTSSRCPTSGSTRGTPPGTWRSTASRWRSSIPTSPRSSSCCCCASGTCIRTASCRPTSGPSATSTRRCTPGRRCASTRSSGGARGTGDRRFLERVFHKLLLNFTWWVNRKDAEGNNIFEGGFLGLDNIGVFDRSKPLPGGGHLEQSDGTSWMAMYSLNMLAIALELARRRSGVRGRRQQVLRALPLHRPRDERIAATPRWPVGRGGRLLLRRRCTLPRRTPDPAQGAVDGRADSALRGRDARAGDAGPAARLPRPDAVVPRRTGPI